MENIVTLREVFSEYEWDERLGAGTVEHLTIDRENRRIAVTLRLPRYVPAAAIEAQAAEAARRYFVGALDIAPRFPAEAMDELDFQELSDRKSVV